MPSLSVHKSALAAARELAELVCHQVQSKPNSVLGLATGATMELVYKEIIDLRKSLSLSFSQVTCFNLDEYVGIDAEHPGSYHSYMRHHLFDHVDVDFSRVHILDGVAADPVAECKAFEQKISIAGGIDLQLLGIGQNAHIGFNEPGSSFSSRTRPIALHPRTLAANAAFFSDGKVPPQALTMGLATIFDARHIVVLATGSAKCDAVTNALYGPISQDCPASLLQKHKNVQWITDGEAAPAEPQLAGRIS